MASADIVRGETLAKALILMSVGIAGWAFGKFIRLVLRLRRMTAVLAAIPKAPPPAGAGLLGRLVHVCFGPVIPLIQGTPWEVMRHWVATCPPIVRIRIFMRPCVIVGSAAGLKRIFQVNPHTLPGCSRRDLHVSISATRPDPALCAPLKQPDSLRRLAIGCLGKGRHCGALSTCSLDGNFCFSRKRRNAA